MNKISHDKIIEILNEIFGEIKPNKAQLDVDLTEFGFDSIMFVQAIVALEETFEVEIPDSKLMISEMNTVNKIFGILSELKNE